MVWSHNDQWMVTGDHAGYVKYWQSNMNNVKMYQAHKEPIRGLRYFILTLYTIFYKFFTILIAMKKKKEKNKRNYEKVGYKNKTFPKSILSIFYPRLRIKIFIEKKNLL